ncbi:MAG: phosphatidylserine decarboxylase family protein [Prevotella sp.]|nr:phosphatidylserine decarboxylase family protein [Prevotella sp.]
MGKRIKKLKKIRIHHEGTHLLVVSAVALLFVGWVLWHYVPTPIPFYVFAAVFGTVWLIALNFFRCPIRKFADDDVDTDHVVVAPADGKVVVIEEVMEEKYLHEKRIMVSIFMSLFNVHANWFPVDGKVKMVHHQNGRFHRAWLPKASDENEMTDIIITTADGVDILCRQVAGAVARRIVTYAKEGEDCYIDEHLGFIKFGSRVDLFLPLGTEIKVTMGQSTTGNQTVVAKLK